VFIAGYIYGVKFDPNPYIDVCEEHGIDFIEDIAQTFSGTQTWIGSPRAVHSMFSFGLIKVQTTISGAISVVRDPALFEEMEKVQNTYPVFEKNAFMKKTVKALMAKTLFGTRPGVYSWHHLADRFSANREEATVGLVRGFSQDQDFLTKFRVQPSPVLLNFMLKRFQRFDQVEFERTSKLLKQSQERLIKAGFFIPGQDTQDRNVWPFPIIVQNSELFMQYMFLKGVIPYKTSTTCKEIKPESSKYAHCPNTRWMMDQVIYAPIHRNIPGPDQEMITKRMADGYQALIAFGEQSGAKFNDDPLTQKYVFRSKL
jgi:dTDP-4-amino-4,6-dideoxygalactose transaminase